MRHYLKYSADIGFGPGMVYLEFEDEQPTRQVEVYRDAWLCSADEYHPGIGPGLADQPFSVLTDGLHLGIENEMMAEEFESLWSEALNRRK